MNSQRAFWLSGALTLAVLAVLGTAINSRNTEPSAPPALSQEASTVESSSPTYRDRDEDEEHEKREHERKDRDREHERERE